MHGSSAISVRILMVDRRTGFHWSFPDLRAPYWRFYWNFAGSAEIRVGERRIELQTETGYLIAPDTSFAAAGTELDHFYVHFTLPHAAHPQDGGVYPIERSSQLAPLVKELADQRTSQQSNETEAPLALSAAGLVLCVLARVPAGAGAIPLSDPLVRAAVQAISSDPGRFVRSEEIARQVGCDERTLRRRFSALMDSTPVQFALRRRIEHSCMLLHFTDHSIDEIADQTGFCDRHHFSRVFRTHRGIGPAGFRAIADQLPRHSDSLE
jgi:AraC-like DNA-binding protein